MTTVPKVAFLFTNPKDALLAAVQEGREADTSLHGLNHFAGADHFTATPRSLRALRLVPRLLRYDFVMTQDNLALGYVVSRAARLFGRPTKWLYLALNASTLMRRHEHHPLRRFLLKTFWQSYAGIICVSTEQQADFVRVGIPKEKLHFIPFGVDTQFFQPTEAALEEALVVSGGRDSGRDYPTLLTALKQTEHPCTIFAGQKSLPADTTLPSNVSVVYNIPLTEVRDLYRRAQLVVIASKEGYPPGASDCSGQTVILDALAAGKAVIATERSWITDYFVPGEDLVVVPPNEPSALAEAIDDLWRDADKRKRLAQTGSAKVALRYSSVNFATALRRVMETIE